MQNFCKFCQIHVLIWHRLSVTTFSKYSSGIWYKSKKKQLSNKMSSYIEQRSINMSNKHKLHHICPTFIAIIMNLILFFFSNLRTNSLCFSNKKIKFLFFYHFFGVGGWTLFLFNSLLSSILITLSFSKLKMKFPC